MTILSDIIAAPAVSSALVAANRKALFAHFGSMAERQFDLDAAIVVERLTERERLGSTGFGSGVAIPHAKVEGLGTVVGMFARLTHAIDFQAIDDLPVDLAFCLLSPPDAGAEHLKALAQVSRWLRDAGFVAKLRGAGSDDAIFAIFSGVDARTAA